MLRSLVPQLKNSSTKEYEMEKVEELAETCCHIVIKCPHVGVDDAEFTQRVSSIYDLFAHFLNAKNSYYNIGLLLLKTTTTCLQQKKNHLQDVESIAENLFSKVWNLSSDKLEDHEMSSFRQTALELSYSSWQSSDLE